MTDHISFSSNGDFSEKYEFCCFAIINQRNSGTANLKKLLCLIKYQNWVKNVLSFRKKIIWRIQFHKKFALRIAHYQPYLIIKTTNMWRHRPDVNDGEKKKTQMEAIYVALYIEISVVNLLWKS